MKMGGMGNEMLCQMQRGFDFIDQIFWWMGQGQPSQWGAKTDVSMQMRARLGNWGPSPPFALMEVGRILKTKKGCGLGWSFCEGGMRIVLSLQVLIEVKIVRLDLIWMESIWQDVIPLVFLVMLMHTWLSKELLSFLPSGFTVYMFG